MCPYVDVGSDAGFVSVYLMWYRPVQFFRIGAPWRGLTVLYVKLITLRRLNLPFAVQESFVIKRRRSDGSVAPSELSDHHVLWHGDSVAVSWRTEYPQEASRNGSTIGITTAGGEDEAAEAAESSTEQRALVDSYVETAVEVLDDEMMDVS